MMRIILLLLFLTSLATRGQQVNIALPSKSSSSRGLTNAITDTAANLLSPITRPKPGTLRPEEIADFDKNSPKIQNLLRDALELSQRGLNYKMGSSEPSMGGMDCSGTIHYLLRQNGWKETPRSSYYQYQWACNKKTFHAVDTRSEKFDETALHPGHLLFWTGTYSTKGRNPPISHVMIYLGKRKSDGKPVMAGASDGRTYDGRQRWGVGVFDFVLPKKNAKAKFIGYAEIPK